MKEYDMTSEQRVKSESIICKDWRCYICHREYGLDLHHCLHGAYKKLADEDGLFIALCRYHHSRLHDFGENDKELKALAQKSYIETKVKEGYTNGQARGIWFSRYGRFFD